MNIEKEQSPNKKTNPLLLLEYISTSVLSTILSEHIQLIHIELEIIYSVDAILDFLFGGTCLPTLRSVSPPVCLSACLSVCSS